MAPTIQTKRLQAFRNNVVAGADIMTKNGFYTNITYTYADRMR